MSESVALPSAPITGSSGDVLGGLSDGQRAHWRMTGELPTSDPAVEDRTPAPKRDVTSASSPTEPATQAAEIAALSTPASEPGTPSKKPSNAESRKADLNAEIRALKAERDRLRADRDAFARPAPDVKPASPPAPANDLASVLARPDIQQPSLSEQAFWDRFPEATVGDYARYVARYELLADRAEAQVQAVRQSRAKSFAEQVAPDGASYAAFFQTQDPRFSSPAFTPVDALPPNVTPTIQNVIAQEIVTSSVAKPLMEYLTAHPAELDALEASPSMAAAIRAIGRLEAKVDAPSTTVPPAAPAASPVSLAPPPAATLGTKPSQPADELQEAIRTGDFARYRELQNRKDMRSA